MVTLFIDLEGGNDNYGGTSFALLASAADGALTVGGAFTSASASFPNDGSLIGQYLSIFNGTIYAVYRVTAWVSATALTVVQITGGTALASLSARQYFIGGRWRSVNTGATAVRTIPGDTIRIKATAGPTSIGNATWTGGGRLSAGGSGSSTNTTPIVITSAAHGFVTGDYISFTGHATNTNAIGIWKVGTTTANTFQILNMDGSDTTGNGVGPGSGTLTKINNFIIKTATPLVQNIALCGGLGQKPAWTASANVTTSQNTTAWKEGHSSANISIGATFTTGKAAYYTLPATLDLSAYQQVSFWVRLQTGTVGAAGSVYVALCTDTVGDTVAHTCNIPSLQTTTAWQPVTVDLGTNLDAAIRSVAFYVVTDNGAQLFQLDNIIACKASSSADSITLTSLFSKSSGTGDEAWYAVQSINYDAVMISNSTNVTSLAPQLRGYNGTTETVNTYKCEAVKILPLNANTVVPNESGTAGNPITYSGGWDRTDMSTQTGQTWIDGANGQNVGLSVTASLAYLNFDRLNVCRFAQGYNIFSSTNNINITSVYATCCDAVGVNFNGTGMTGFTFGSVWVNNNGSTAGLSMLSLKGAQISNIKSAENNTVGAFIGTEVTIDSVIAGNSITTGLNLIGSVNSLIKTATITNCRGVPAIIAYGTSNFVIAGGSTSNNGSGGTFGQQNYSTEFSLNNFTINEATEVAFAANSNGNTFVYANRLDDTDNNSWVFQGRGTVNQQTAVVDSPATTSWRMRPTDATVTSLLPIRLKLGTVVCATSSAVTVTARMRRDNTGLTMRLACPGGQISGVASDVTADMTAVANTWETVTITFTPTKAGAVDIYAYAFGGTTFSGYVSNITASQV